MSQHWSPHCLWLAVLAPGIDLTITVGILTLLWPCSKLMVQNLDYPDLKIRASCEVTYTGGSRPHWRDGMSAAVLLEDAARMGSPGLRFWLRLS